jgi:hypothetical protein
MKSCRKLTTKRDEKTNTNSKRQRRARKRTLKKKSCNDYLPRAENKIISNKWWRNGLMNGCGEPYVVRALVVTSTTTTPQPTIPVRPDTKNTSYTNGDGSLYFARSLGLRFK